MSKPLKSSDLIRTTKRRAMMPTNQAAFSEEDFLEILNEEINIFGVPHLLRTHEEYLVRAVDFPLEAGKDTFPIPARAVGGKLRDVQYVDANGEIHDELSRISLEELADYKNLLTASSNLDTNLCYVIDNSIKLLNENPVLSGSLRMYIYMKPNTLVEEKRVGTIQSVDKATGTVIVESMPSVFTNGAKYDFVGHEAPNKIREYDKVSVTVNANTRTLVFASDDIPDTLVVGDYVCLATESPVPQLPSELHPILAQRAAVACLEAIGDVEGGLVAQKKLERMEVSANSIIDNRIEGAPQKIHNRFSPLSNSSGNRGRGIK